MEDNLSRLYEEKNDPTYFSNERREMLRFIPKTCRKLLDVGCGTGEFGALVKKELGAEVWGVELNAKAAESAREKLDKLVHAPFSAEVELPGNYFDVITFNDSLEHFPDPYPPLEFCKGKLAKGGVVVCSLPNVRYIENVYHFLVDMDWKYEDYGILDSTHLKFFTRKSMLRTFENAGYNVQSITGIRPHYWSGKKIFLLRLFFKKWMDDMKYLNYVSVISPR